MNKKINVFILISLLYGCGGSDSKNEIPSPPATPELQSNTIEAGVELGPVKNATVTIESLDGHFFQDYITDENGNYTIDIDSIKKLINDYDSSIKYVRITSSGGTDTDPDDDGIIDEDEMKAVNGSVSGIIPIEKLFSDKAQNINLITTAVSNILGNTLSFTDEQIIKVAHELGAEDIDQDGLLTIDDLIYYKMAENESRAESFLRTTLLDHIHQNNAVKINEFIKKSKLELSTVNPVIINQSSTELNIKFSQVTQEHYIQYGLKNDAVNVNFSQYYTDDTLTLSKSDVLYYQECSLSEGCYKIQKLFFDGSDIFHDYLEYEEKPESLNDNQQLTALSATISDLVVDLTDLDEKIKEQENYIDGIEIRTGEM